MRGHQDLIELRKRGLAPSVLVIDLADEAVPNGGLTVGRSERPSPADLRCVVGLTVSVHGEDVSAVHAMRDACIEAKARRVIATVTKCTNATPKYERFETIEVTDTEGHMVWPN